MDTRINQLRDAALAAAARGWHVFPVRSGAKRPALHGLDRCPGTGPCADGHQGWEQRATTDPDRIRAAWSQAPFNIGLATGPSGLCVIDCDTAKPDEVPPEPWNEPGVTDGEDVLAVVAERAGHTVPADTLTVATPSSGLHLYFRAPHGETLRKTEGDRGQGLGWKIDTRAWGGYVVAPGSVTPAGRYAITYDTEPAALPGWLVDRLRPAPLPAAPPVPIRPAPGRRSRYLDAALRAECARVADAQQDRNANLYAAAVALGQLVAGGALTEAEVRSALMTAAGRHIGVQWFTEREADLTITSGLRAGGNRPRRIA